MAVRVNVIGFHGHVGAVVDRAVDHRVDLRGRAVQQLRVDHHRALLDVPVDQYAATTVTGMPLGEHVLIERSEMQGVRGDGGGAGAPQTHSSRSEGGIGDVDRDPPRRLGAQVAAPRVTDIVLAVAVRA